jgi:tyrosine-protein kinase Etk/Wzc
MGIFSKNKMREKRAIKASEQRKHLSSRAEYLLNDDTPFDVTEAFRNLKASISVSVPKKNGGLAIMATSAFPEDGKTTVTVNLALMFAQSDAKVVLVDADIRKGRVAKYFKQKSVPGLSDYLSGQKTLQEVTHVSHVNKNLSYITCGTHSPRPYELLESEEMVALLDQLREEYDYIIIDTPPVLLLSDALALSPAVDGSVLVCRHQVSYISDIERALDILKFSKVNVLGVIINDYKAPKTKGYYGGYHGYGYKKYYYYHSYAYDTREYKASDTADQEETDETQE